MEKINNSALIAKHYKENDIGNLFTVPIIDDLFLVKFIKGESIQKEGDRIENLYFMVSGGVKVSLEQENGKSKLICFLDGFRLIGDVELFAGSDCVYQVMAIKETYCLALNLRKYRDVLLNDEKFTKYIAKEMATIVLESNQSTSFNLLYSIETRVATYILLMSKDGKFQDNLTRVAELLATSYRHLHRVISGLCSKKILEKEGKTYKIIDEKALRELANESISNL